MSDTETNHSSSEEYSASSEESEYITENIADPRVEKTVTEMMEARGYYISQSLHEEEVKTLVAQKEGSPDIHVLFATDYLGEKEMKFNIKSVNFYIAYIDKQKLKHVIIIYQGKITSLVKDTISNYQIFRKIKIEVFTQNELKFNITKHRLVPRHEALSKEDSKIFKQKYGTKFNNMFTTDPVARFYGYEKGDVIKIYRKGGVIVYRIVI